MVTFLRCSVVYIATSAAVAAPFTVITTTTTISIYNEPIFYGHHELIFYA